jgi:uncharacterized phage protein gp47/JayE
MTIPKIIIDANGVTIPTENLVLIGTIETFKTTLGIGLNLDVNNPSSLSTPQGQLAQAIANIISRFYDAFAFMMNQFNPRYAIERWQDGLAWINGLTRKQATRTVTAVTCYGLDGTQITAKNLPTTQGTKVRDIYGRTFTCIQNGIITGGFVTVSFECDTAGLIESPANSITIVDLTVIGLDSCNNITAGVTGRNVENQKEFEARRYASVQALGHSTVSTIFGKVFAVAGVTDCWVDENYTNLNYPKRGVILKPHSIIVCVIGGTDNDVAKAIIDSKSAGADMNGDVTVTVGNNTATFYRATPIALFVRVKITSNPTLASNTTAIVQELIYDSVNGLYGQKRITIGDRVVANRFTTFLQNNLPDIELQDIDVSIDGGSSWHDLVLLNANQIAVADRNWVVVQYV